MRCAFFLALLLLLSTPLSQPLHAADCPSGLRIIARTGQSVGGQTITTIRPGVSINDRGTIAFAAFTSSGRGALLAMTPDGQLKEPRPGGTLVNGYGVQINNSDDIAFLVGPGISTGFDYCIPADPPAVGCIGTLSAAEVVFSLLAVNATDASRPTRTLTYSYVTDAQNTIVNPRNGPWTSVGPAFSFNNAGNVAFIGDISVNRQITSYALGTFTPPNTFPTPRPVDVLTRPMLADNGSIAYKTDATESSPILVANYALSTTATAASTSDGFAWLGLYPGITDSGQRVTFTGRFTGSTNILPTGDGLYLSTFANGQWTNRLVLGTNHWGTNVFSRFHSYYRTCVADLSTRPNSVRICFGAASPTGRVGLYAVTYDYALDEASSLTTLVEAGRDLCGLGNPTSFELFDAVNDHGEVAFWVQTSQGDAVIQRATVVEAIDPLPELLANGVITTDYDLLATATNKVQGLAADGATRVVLRVETPGQGLATFSLRDELGQTTGAGTLSEIGSTDEKVGVTVPSQFVDGKWMAFAILRSPTNFARLLQNDEPLAFRRLNVIVEFVPSGHAISEEIARAQFRLHRPPVVLMHGIWSGSDTWEWPLLSDQRFQVHAHDYHETTADSFAINRFQPLAAISIALQQMRSNRIAAVQVDYIGHSMGGLLARRHISAEDSELLRTDLQYRRADNFFAGDIHKLITLDTPHRGTELADLLIAPDGGRYPAADIFEKLLGCMDCGAVADLRTYYSHPIRNLPAAVVPAHAIVGTGGRDVQDRVTALSFLLGPYWGGLVKALNFIPTAAFLLQTHDLIVSEESQRGGLSVPHLSTFDYEDLTLNLNLGIHVSVTGEARINERVIELLNASITSGLFALNGFPANVLSPSPQFAAAAAATAPPAFVQGLDIISPVSGVSVAAGASVSVTVTATNAFQPAKVLLIGPWGADLAEAAPFTLMVNVPVNWLGPLAVKAFGVDSNGIFAEAPEIVLNVNTTATLTNLALRPDTIYLFDYAQTKQVDVYGQFSDGIERKLAAGEQRWITIDGSVATVTTDGLVEARGVGQTTLWVRNGPFAASAPIVVLGTPFTNPPPRLAQHLEIIDLGTNVTSLTDINNAGQVLLTISVPEAVNQQRPAIWQNGSITPLARPPDTAAYALTESGLVGGKAPGPSVWITSSNLLNLSYTNGPLPNRWYDAGVGDLYDTDVGLMGFVNIPGDCGIAGCGPPTTLRFLGTEVGQLVVPQGIPAGFHWAGVNRMNRHGILVGSIYKVENEVRVSSLAAFMDTSNRLTVLPHAASFSQANGLNEVGDIVGVDGGAVLWRNGTDRILIDSMGTATAINNRGHVATYRWGGFPPPNDAAIWADGKITALNELFAESDWTGFAAIAAMNDRGWVICTAGYKQQGARQVLIKLGPAVRTQPVSRTKVPGQTVNFSALSFGVGDIVYQWRHNGSSLVNGARIAGANTSQLTISQLQMTDAGAYDLVIADAYGTTTSSNALLTVLDEGCLTTTNGLVAHWSGDGHAQEVLNRHSATLMNGAAFSNGLVNSAFSFDGLNDFLTTDLNVHPSVMPVTTWEAWIFPSQTNYVDYQGVFSDLKNSRVLYITGSDRFSVPETGGGLPKVSLNEWQHIALIFHPDFIEFYKNGERFVTWYAPAVSQDSSVLTIGRRDDSFPFQGLIDELGIYNRALTQTEIKAIYDVEYAGKCHPQMAPTLTSQPSDSTSYTGFDVPIAVGTRGTAPLSYRWFQDGTNFVANTTGGRLILKNVQPNQAGGYTVVVSNAFGVVTSAVANLVVRAACENQWQLVTGVQTPQLNFASMTFDEIGQVVLAHNDRGETYYWSGNWGLAARTNLVGNICYDIGRNLTVLFSASGQTWEWDWNSWVQVYSGGPTGRTEHAMAYDAERGVTVLFGGTPVSGVVSGDTWIWDGFEWAQVAGLGTGGSSPTCVSPPARRAHQMVYDSARQRIILFGGVDSAGRILADTWEWDGSCWRELHPAQSPPSRYYFGMVYHADRQSVMVFGGSGIAGYHQDFWELIGNSWVQLPVQRGGNPNLGQYYGRSAVYDSFRNVIVNPRGSEETWVWKTPDIPLFEQQPVAQTRFIGESTTISACAVGRGTLSYQWFFNGQELSGAALSSLPLGLARADQAGTYFVIVSNGFGSVTSLVARLNVLPCQSAPTNLVAWWRAEGDAADSVGTNHGVLVNGPNFAVGKVGQAFRFDGDNDLVKVNASTNLNLTVAAGFTVEGWIQPRDWQPRPLVEWNGGSNENVSVGVHLWTSVATNGGPGSLFANIRRTNSTDNILISAPALLDTNGWQHVALTYARALGAAVLFLNGSVVATQSVGSFRTATTADVYLGGRPGTTNVFAGLMDEMTIYNRALSATEISALAAAGSAGKCTEPEGTPYIYVNGVRATEHPFIVLSDDAPQAALLSTDLNATLWYSLDDIPPLGGFLYAGPFNLPDIAPVQAIAVSTNGSNSQIAYRSILRFPADFVAPNHLAMALRDASAISFILRGTANRRYVLERSADLLHWTPISSTIAPLDGVARMKDTSPPAGQAFYRAVGE